MKNNNIKADDKVQHDGYEPQKFTNFELLQKEVEVLKEGFDEVVEILRENNFIRTKEIEAKYFDDDEVFKRLEKEE